MSLKAVRCEPGGLFLWARRLEGETDKHNNLTSFGHATYVRLTNKTNIVSLTIQETKLSHGVVIVRRRTKNS